MPIQIGVPSSAQVGAPVCITVSGAGSQPPVVTFAGRGSVSVSPTPVLGGSVWEVCFTPTTAGPYRILVAAGTGHASSAIRVK